jgi:hypothetical protein
MEGMPMLSQDTADCLALANTAILMRLIEDLTKRGVIPTPPSLLRDAVCDLEKCPEQTTRVEDAVRLIKNELMPRITGL